MSEVSAGVLQQQVAQIQRIEQQDKWFKSLSWASCSSKSTRLSPRCRCR